LEVATLVAEATEGKDLDLVIAALLHDYSGKEQHRDLRPCRSSAKQRRADCRRRVG
jgi:predicted HD phosphohydrolase